MGSDLPLAFVALAFRLRTSFTDPPHDEAIRVRDLVEETYDLVKQHPSDVDTLRVHFRTEHGDDLQFRVGSA